MSLWLFHSWLYKTVCFWNSLVQSSGMQCDHFIHRHFHRVAIWLGVNIQPIWYHILPIECCLLLVASCIGVNLPLWQSRFLHTNIACNEQRIRFMPPGDKHQSPKQLILYNFLILRVTRFMHAATELYWANPKVQSLIKHEHVCMFTYIYIVVYALFKKPTLKHFILFKDCTNLTTTLNICLLLSFTAIT